MTSVSTHLQVSRRSGNQKALEFVKLMALSAGLTLSAFAPDGRASVVISPPQLEFEFNHEYRLDVDLRYLSSSANYSSDGTSTDLTQISSYGIYALDATFGARLRNWLYVFGTFRGDYRQLKQPNSTATQFGPTDQQLGAAMKLASFGSNRFSWILQGDTEFALYSNTSAQQVNQAYAGDGTLEVTGMTFLHYRDQISSDSLFEGSIGGGYRFRPASMADGIALAFRLEFNPIESGFQAGLGVSGLITGTAPTPSTVLGTGALGSGFVLSPSPDLWTAGAELGYRINSQHLLSLSYAMSLAGSDSPQYSSLGLTYRLNFGDVRNRLGGVSTSPNESFETYESDARVVATLDALNQIRVGAGVAEGLEAGVEVEIFDSVVSGTGNAVARGRVISAEDKTAVIQVIKFYKEVWIQPGFVIRW